jgi:hypothetical protein
MGPLDGSDCAPAKTIEVHDSNKQMIQVENPSYVAWIAKDQLVLRFLLNSLSLEILSQVLDMDTTATTWTTINSMFKTASCTKAQHLREKLNDTKKITMTVDQYYTKMKGFAFELSALGKPVGDNELLGYLLHGLDKVEYNSLITLVNGNPNTSLDDFYEKLCGYDMRNGVEENGTFISLANLARRGYDHDRRLCGNTPPPHGYSPPFRGRIPDHGSYHGGGGGDRYHDRDDDSSTWRRDERRDDDCRGDRRDDRHDRRNGDGDRYHHDDGDSYRRDDGDRYRRNDGGGHRPDRTPT